MQTFSEKYLTWSYNRTKYAHNQEWDLHLILPLYLIASCVTIYVLCQNNSDIANLETE